MSDVIHKQKNINHGSLLSAGEGWYTKYSRTEELSNIHYVSIAAKVSGCMRLQVYRCGFDLVSLG